MIATAAKLTGMMEATATVENRLRSGIISCFQYGMEFCDCRQAKDGFYVRMMCSSEYMNTNFILTHTYQ
jgi:hypothetical protein